MPVTNNKDTMANSPAKDKKQVAFWMKKSTLATLDAEARALGLSRASFVTMLVVAWLEKKIKL